MRETRVREREADFEGDVEEPDGVGGQRSRVATEVRSAPESHAVK